VQPVAEAHVIRQTAPYLDGALDLRTRQAFEAHVAVCPVCAQYLRELREALRIGGEHPAEPLDPQARNRLLAAFRAWRDGRHQA
jgi:anti-sigma factor RsiW